jgi:hypothetical protein
LHAGHDNRILIGREQVTKLFALKGSRELAVVLRVFRPLAEGIA